MQFIPDVEILREIAVTTDAYGICRLQPCVSGALIDTDRGSVYYSFAGRAEVVPGNCAVVQNAGALCIDSC